MEAAKKPRNKTNKQVSFVHILRASFFITMGLLIVNIYYLSTKDQLLPQLLKIYSASLSFVQSIPTFILIMIGYSILIFSFGYYIGKRKK